MRGPLLAHAGAPSESSTDVQSESAVSGAGSAVAITPRLGLADPAHRSAPQTLRLGDAGSRRGALPRLIG